MVVASAGTTIEKERGMERKRVVEMRLDLTMHMVFMSLGTHGEVNLGTLMTSCIFKKLSRRIKRPLY